MRFTFWLIVVIVVVWALICVLERVGEELKNDDEEKWGIF
jgi:hypothetical protein